MLRSLIVFVLAILVYGCGPGDLGEMGKEDLAGALKDMHSNIHKVDMFILEDGKYRASIFYSENTAVSPSSLIFMSATGIKEVCEKIFKNNGQDQISELLFFVRDKTDALLMKVWYESEDLSNLEWETTLAPSLLDVARDIEFRPAGRSAARAFCKKDSNREQSPGFCRSVL